MFCFRFWKVGILAMTNPLNVRSKVINTRSTDSHHHARGLPFYQGIGFAALAEHSASHRHPNNWGNWHNCSLLPHETHVTFQCQRNSVSRLACYQMRACLVVMSFIPFWAMGTFKSTTIKDVKYNLWALFKLAWALFCYPLPNVLYMYGNFCC